jgi:hypothetical protein
VHGSGGVRVHLHDMSYHLLRPVVAADVTAEHAPKAVAASAKRLVAAIDARIKADADWLAAKDLLTKTQGSQADAIAEARIRDRPDPEALSIEELQRDVDAKAVERDASAKLAARIEREHADVVAEHADEWRSSLDTELEKLAAEVAGHAAALETAFERIDLLRNAREVTTAETRRNQLYRFRARRHTSEPRETVKRLRKWLTPPAPPRKPVAQNFGNVMSPAAREFMAREEAR